MKLNPAVYGKGRADILAQENPDKRPIVLSDCLYCKACLTPKEGTYHFHGYVEDLPKKKKTTKRVKKIIKELIKPLKKKSKPKK